MSSYDRSDRVHNTPRGHARHRLANPKLYRKKNPVTRLVEDGVHRTIGSYFFEDDPKDLPPFDKSPEPWIQIALCGIMIAGFNTYLAQFLLGMTNPPNLIGRPVPVPVPVGGIGRHIQESVSEIIDNRYRDWEK